MNFNGPLTVKGNISNDTALTMDKRQNITNDHLEEKMESEENKGQGRFRFEKVDGIAGKS